MRPRGGVVFFAEDAVTGAGGGGRSRSGTQASMRDCFGGWVLSNVRVSTGGSAVLVVRLVSSFRGELVAVMVDALGAVAWV